MGPGIFKRLKCLKDGLFFIQEYLIQIWKDRIFPILDGIFFDDDRIFPIDDRIVYDGTVYFQRLYISLFGTVDFTISSFENGHYGAKNDTLTQNST